MEKLTGHGYPHPRMVGEVGQHYEDLDTGDLYECRVASEYSPIHGWPVGGYVWERRAKGEDIREIYGSSGGSGDSSNNGPGTMLVKCVRTNGDNISSDKSSDEIGVALDAGKFVYAEFEGQRYMLNNITRNSNSNEILGVVFSCIYIDNKGVVTSKQVGVVMGNTGYTLSQTFNLQAAT